MPCGTRAIWKKSGALWAAKSVNTIASRPLDGGRSHSCAPRSGSWWGKCWTKDRCTMTTHREGPQEGPVRRRAILVTGAAGIVIGAARVTHAVRHTDEEGVTAPEDLMKEHGVLNRCLLVYEE